MSLQTHLNTLTHFAQGLPKISGARIIAALVYKDKIIALGRNQHKTHPLAKKFNRSETKIHLHAEINVIVNSLNSYNRQEIKSSYLLVCRVRRVGHKWSYGLAAPCEGCWRAINAFKIPLTYYTCNSDFNTNLSACLKAIRRA